MKLGTEVGYGPGHIVLDGDPVSPLKKGHSPQFSAMSIVAKRLDAKMPLCTDVGLGPGDIVLDGAQLPPKRGTPFNFRPITIVAKLSPISATAELLLHSSPFYLAPTILCLTVLFSRSDALKNAPSRWGIYTHVVHVPWTRLTQYPKLHLDRFSRFCAAHR